MYEFCELYHLENFLAIMKGSAIGPQTFSPNRHINYFSNLNSRNIRTKRPHKYQFEDFYLDTRQISGSIFSKKKYL